MIAVIVAAGLGSRLKGRTEKIPKGFLEVGGKALIRRSLEALSRHGLNQIIIGTGYHREFYDALAAEQEGISCVFSPIFKDTSSFYTLYNMRDAIKEDFLLLESDLIYEDRALEMILQDPRDNVVLASDATKSEDEVFIETDSHEVILNMSKKPHELNSIDGELVGINKVTLDQYRLLCGLGEKDEALLMKGDYETAFVRLSSQSPFYMKKVDGLVWAEIDCEEHLDRVNQNILPRLEEK